MHHTLNLSSNKSNSPFLSQSNGKRFTQNCKPHSVSCKREFPHTKDISVVQAGGPLVLEYRKVYPMHGMVLVFERSDEGLFGGGWELGDVNNEETGRKGLVVQLVHQ